MSQPHGHTHAHAGLFSILPLAAGRCFPRSAVHPLLAPFLPHTLVAESPSSCRQSHSLLPLLVKYKHSRRTWNPTFPTESCLFTFAQKSCLSVFVLFHSTFPWYNLICFKIVTSCLLVIWECKLVLLFAYCRALGLTALAEPIKCEIYELNKAAEIVYEVLHPGLNQPSACRHSAAKVSVVNKRHWWVTKKLR